MFEATGAKAHCESCVYYPPNLPVNAYSAQDYRMLRAKDCSFDYQPGSEDCCTTRKTSCSLLDLEHLQRTVKTQETAS